MMHRKIFSYNYQAVQLWDRTLGTRLADIPNFDATLSSGVHVLGGIGNRNGAHHLTVA